ncbi:MAG: hypothetical protein HY717_21580 [Planctomycetes bacterium]|nr:hypothetical protein [Planctomycetota bacterium]
MKEEKGKFLDFANGHDLSGSRQPAHPYVAVLITGTCREIAFLLELFPHLAGPVPYDIYLVLRHVRARESSRLGAQERDFQIGSFQPYLNPRTFICELPSVDPAVAAERYLIPVGPVGEERECGQLSMLHGVFSAMALMRASLRPYTHVLKTRTDYLPWRAPWISGMLQEYEESGGKILVDGALTKPQRYPDRPDLPWQGSISDLFCFASVEQFLKLWNSEEILPKVWTGLVETTLFRIAMFRFLGDDLQSPRRNQSLLSKYFFWHPNDTKQSFHFLRAGVLTGPIKRWILDSLNEGNLEAASANGWIRATYDFICGSLPEAEFKQRIRSFLPAEQVKEYFEACCEATSKACPV